MPELSPTVEASQRHLHALPAPTPLDDQPPGGVERQVVSVAIDALRSGDSPRQEGVNTGHVHMLAELGGEALPPILVHRPTMQVIDGMHRLCAARLNGQACIQVQFFDGSSQHAYLLAVKANITHGLPLTLAERRAAAERIAMENPQLSDRAIAAAAGLAAKTVAAIRRRTAHGSSYSNSRIGRDGRVRPLDSTEGRRVASEIIAADPTASLRAIARQSGISVGTARDVRRRVLAGEEPVPAGTRARTNGADVTKAARTSPAGPDIEVDPRNLLDGLRRDPSLRYTDVGRSLLRWLGSRTIGAEEWRSLIDDIPPHCPVMVSRIARACAASWLALADELDRKGGPVG